MPIDSAKYATTIAQSIAVRFMRRVGAERCSGARRWRDDAGQRAHRGVGELRRALGRSCCCSRVGFTRLVSRTMNRSCCGSIQIDVPGEAGVPEGARRHDVVARAELRAHSGVSASRARGRERASPVRVVNCVIVAARRVAHAVERAAVQVHLREAREVVRRAEDPRVRRNAAEVVRALVVHLAAHESAAPRIDTPSARCAGAATPAGWYIVSCMPSGWNT